MCHLRAQRHACGHLVSRPVSSCRFTYLAPGSGERPLCHASPGLVINLPTSCRQCDYNVFCQRWELRLSEARSKQTAARMLLRDVLQEEDDWAAGEWGSPSSPVDGDDEEERGRPDWGRNTLSPTDDTFGWGGLGDTGFSDTGAARRERERADREVDSLWSQYQRGQWSAWRYFVSGPSVESESPHRRSFRRRQTQGRFPGPSRLSTSTSIDDLPDIVPVAVNYEDEWDRRNSAPSPGSEQSQESEGSDQGGVSAASLARNIRSDVSSDWKTWAWPKAGRLPPPGVEHLNLSTSGRTSPPSPTTLSPPTMSPSSGMSPSSLSSVTSAWDEDDDSGAQFGVASRYRPRASNDSGIAMMEAGGDCSSKSSVDQDDDWLPAWGVA